MRVKVVVGLAAIVGIASWAITAVLAPSAAAGSVLAVNDLPTVIDNLRNTIVGLLAGLATLFLTIGGVLYLFAAGDPEQVSKAKNALKSAAIGYGVAVLAPVLLTLLKKVVGAP
jgi:hypothetical protein